MKMQGIMRESGLGARLFASVRSVHIVDLDWACGGLHGLVKGRIDSRIRLWLRTGGLVVRIDDLDRDGVT